ncbi:MAG: hypothetical protein EBX36_10550 [Planctomycetia bacterium]|nr:hypothetical protein [Planctomycetia bacterium]
MAVVVDPSLPYDREIAKGVAQYAREVGTWRLYIEEEAPRRLPDFATWAGHGVIASFDDERIAGAVAAAGLPAVAVGGGGGYYDPATGIPYVDTDNEQVAVLAAEHLLECGLASCGYYGLAPARTTGWCWPPPARRAWNSWPGTRLRSGGISRRNSSAGSRACLSR